MKEKNKGITLIALIITIVILLILAGISILSLTKINLFGQAKNAKEQTAIVFIQKSTNQKYSSQPSLNQEQKPLQTGTTNDKQCNIFDMASNLREWSTESSSNYGAPCVMRGGRYYWSGIGTGARGSVGTSTSQVDIGFRPILYINTNS